MQPHLLQLLHGSDLLSYGLCQAAPETTAMEVDPMGFGVLPWSLSFTVDNHFRTSCLHAVGPASMEVVVHPLQLPDIPVKHYRLLSYISSSFYGGFARQILTNTSSVELSFVEVIKLSWRMPTPALANSCVDVAFMEVVEAPWKMPSSPDKCFGGKCFGGKCFHGSCGASMEVRSSFGEGFVGYVGTRAGISVEGDAGCAGLRVKAARSYRAYLCSSVPASCY